jgi:hypothetical protein
VSDGQEDHLGPSDWACCCTWMEVGTGGFRTNRWYDVLVMLDDAHQRGLLCQLGRLLQELRLRQITMLEAANEFLRSTCRPRSHLLLKFCPLAG